MRYRTFYEISEETFRFYQKRLERCIGVPGWEKRYLHVAFLDEEDGSYSVVLINAEDDILDAKIFRFHFL